MIPYFGLQAVSGGAGVLEGWRQLRETAPANFNAIGGASQSVPFSTLFTGVLLLNLFYWCTNQQIIQRTFAATSLAEGQRGVFLAGFLKLLGPLYLVLPGLIAWRLFAGRDLRPDHAYGMLVREVLPAPLAGFFAAVMVGAILSSFNSALNSTQTLFSLGLYRGLLRRNATDEQAVRAGKRFGWAVAVITMTIAPMLAGQESIFRYLQKMNGIYFIPIFAVVTVGLLSRRVPAFAAKVALVAGFSLIAIGYFVPPFDRWVAAFHEFHFLGAVFVLLVATMLAIAAVRPRSVPWQQADVGAVNLAPWRHARFAGLVLVGLVLLLYVVFADFDVLRAAGP
jgi:SSS family solute:Na+ symporter